MVWNWTSYALPLFGAALICLLVAGLGWRRRGPGATAFTALLLAVALWAATYGLELLSEPLAQKVFWAKVQYFGIVLIPVAWFVFALQYADRVAQPGVPLLALLMAVPLITLALLWNPSANSLIWTHAEIVEGSSINLLRLSRGPWFWVHTAYSYLLWATAAMVLLRAMRLSPPLYRKQGLAVGIAVLSPWILNVLYVAGAVVVDPTPFGFTLTGVAMFWTLTQQQFLDIMPVARASIVEEMSDGFVVLDADERIVDLNPAAETAIGEAASTVLGRHFDDVLSGRVELHDLTGANNELQLEAVLSGGGEPRNFELRSWPLHDRHQNDCGRLIVFRDISNQKKAEEALRGSEERLEMVIRQMPAVLWTTDGDLRFTEMLGAGLQQLRVSPDAASGMDLFEFVGTIDKTHPAIAAHMNALDGIPSTYSVEWFGRDFECHVEPLIDRNGSSCGVIGVGLDVTERQDLQEQLRQSQKMEAIGRMAGGVAHDFNNLLTAVTGYAQLAKEDLDSLDSNPAAIAHLRRDLDAISQASERATAITAQLLAFSRRQVLQPRVVQLNAVLEDMDKMMRRLIGDHIELATFFDDETAPIKADPVQIQQVLINLVLNSRDAMPNGGKIKLEIRNANLRQARAGRYDTIQPGKYVLLTVSDDGFGMDARTQAHVFEPFFTTKEEGKGTGLGLSTVYGIIKQTGGSIEVDSVLGKGTTFQIYFPVASEDEDGPEGEQVSVAGSRRLRGTETLLFVEDEEMVRLLGTRVLSSHGYLVLEAEDGDQALEVCKRHEGPIDLVVTDVVMPGMNGRELAQRLATIIPDAEVLFISGYTGGALIEHGVLQEDTNFLQKPFSPQRLVQKVREVLDAHG